MLNLQQGIKIFSHLDNNYQRIWLSSGTVKALEIMPVSSCYCQDAFLPRDNWREPTFTELDILWTNQEPSIDNGIAIIRIPENLLDIFRGLGINSINNKEQIENLLNNENYPQAILKITEYISQFCLDKSKLIVNGIAAHKIGLHTVTTDRNRNNCYTGLHLDSWEQLPLNQRHQATNRISINLGRDARYLLFINLSLMKMFNLLHITDSEKIKKHQHAIFVREEFFKLYPNYPVVKLKIEPGEAYIAPTENMIHDGCTTNKNFFDLSLTFRGHFKLG